MAGKIDSRTTIELGAALGLAGLLVGGCMHLSEDIAAVSGDLKAIAAVQIEQGKDIEALDRKVDLKFDQLDHRLRAIETRPR
jgi:hypothetical protein